MSSEQTHPATRQRTGASISPHRADPIRRLPRRHPGTPKPAVRPRAIHISTGGDSIFAIHHPAAGRSRRVGVLICPPFGWEDMSSYRSRREWAIQLSGAGFDVLRFDFPGSGDSAGGPRDPGRLDAWTGAVEASAMWLSDVSRARRIAAIGIGLGGSIAYRALAMGAPIDDLILWGVSAKGRRHLRELRAFSYLERRHFAEQSDEPAVEDSGDGSLVVAGYTITAETQSALDDLDLSNLDFPARPGARVLMLERDGQPVDSSLKAAIERSHAALTVRSGDGYAAMMMADLPHAVSAYEVFGTVSSWLAADGDPHPLSPHIDGSPAEVEPGSAPESSSVIATGDGGLIRETAITIPHGRGELVGILTEPTGPAVGLCALWLNAGPQRRIGPNRMWVEAARRWAALGVPTFRVDLNAIGDADGESSKLLDNNNYYTGDYLEQVHLVLDELTARGLPDRFLVGGLCAGAYWALHIAAEDTRVVAAAVLNPGYLIYDRGLSNAIGQSRSVLSRLSDPHTWRRVLRGNVTPGAHLRALRIILAARLRALPRSLVRRLSRTRQDDDELTRIFDRLKDQDQRALIMFAGEERLHAQLTAAGRLEGLDRWPNVSLHHVPYPGEMHTLRPLSLQHESHRLIDELLERELARAGRWAPPEA